jgi:hypothetical protein
MAQTISLLAHTSKQIAGHDLYIRTAMPTRTIPNKSEPTPFACPSCGAKYLIVTIEVPSDVQQNKFGCLKCDALFPVGQGRASLEYIIC